MANSEIQVLRAKILEIKQQNQSYCNTLKELISSEKTEKSSQFICYFTYSLNLAHGLKSENLCIGSFHLLNSGTAPITNPCICIQLSKEAPFEFSGKYVNKGMTVSKNLSVDWERINEPSNKEEIWLKPLKQQTVEPNQKLTFPSFQLKWLPKESYSGQVNGFGYCDEFNEGMAALNTISLSGTVPEQGEKNEEES
ncbi:hypothetical protein [Halobacillus massiliensis]|uniref:hypothetical protein n=1 Tax=Halobacillus massiliensis TaxID=1926286 RepID=UPI0009E2753E|nr:hypothetical protein [Halobacillus massiliensis]